MLVSTPERPAETRKPPHARIRTAGGVTAVSGEGTPRQVTLLGDDVGIHWDIARTRNWRRTWAPPLMRSSRVGRGDQPPWSRLDVRRNALREANQSLDSAACICRSGAYRIIRRNLGHSPVTSSSQCTASSPWCMFAQYFRMIGKMIDSARRGGHDHQLCEPRIAVHRRLRGNIPQQVVDDDGHAGHDRRCRRTDHPGVGATGGRAAEACSPKPPTLSCRSCRRSSPPVADEGWLGDPLPIARERSPRPPSPDGSPRPAPDGKPPPRPNLLRQRSRPDLPRVHVVAAGDPAVVTAPTAQALILDEVAEVLPAPTVSTGLAVHYDALGVG